MLPFYRWRSILPSLPNDLAEALTIVRSVIDLCNYMLQAASDGVNSEGYLTAYEKLEEHLARPQAVEKVLFEMHKASDPGLRFEAICAHDAAIKWGWKMLEAATDTDCGPHYENWQCVASSRRWPDLEAIVQACELEACRAYAARLANPAATANPQPNQVTPLSPVATAPPPTSTTPPPPSAGTIATSDQLNMPAAPLQPAGTDASGDASIMPADAPPTAAETPAEPDREAVPQRDVLSAQSEGDEVDHENVGSTGSMHRINHTEKAVLYVLDEAALERLTVEQIQARIKQSKRLTTKPSKRTLDDVVPRLIRKGLAERSAGTKGGVLITREGKVALKNGI